jgi:hypothetical protein
MPLPGSITRRFSQKENYKGIDGKSRKNCMRVCLLQAAKSGKLRRITFTGSVSDPMERFGMRHPFYTHSTFAIVISF